MNQKLPPGFIELYCAVNFAVHERKLYVPELITPAQIHYLSSQLVELLADGEKLNELLEIYDTLQLRAPNFLSEPDEARIEELVEIGLQHCTPAELVGIITNPAIILGLSEVLMERLIDQGQLPVPWSVPASKSAASILPPIDTSFSSPGLNFVLSNDDGKNGNWRIRLSRLVMLAAAKTASGQSQLQVIDETGWLLRLSLTNTEPAEPLMQLDFRNPIRLDSDVRAEVSMLLHGNGPQIFGVQKNDKIIFPITQREELEKGFILKGQVATEDICVLFCTRQLSLG